MKKYIGTKQIEAEPMKMGEADEKCLIAVGGKLTKEERSINVIVLNTKMVTKVGRLPNRLRNRISVQTPFLIVCILK